MSRHVLFLDLVDEPELVAAYEAHHAPGGVPAEILESIRAAGIEQMEIYRSGNRLVMIMDTGQNYDPAEKAKADRANPAVLAWERLMDRFQTPLPWARPGEKWLAGKAIFTLNPASAAT
ncbi:L-rhamnose mutarotase [Sphingosinicella sp. BN140058]|uniref:L-rhamnose mutarotase n=1 Tax=Sphingosinicella sp. BN140058 TaxID=1892855 RepID=UPI00267BF5B4